MEYLPRTMIRAVVVPVGGVASRNPRRAAATRSESRVWDRLIVIACLWVSPAISSAQLPATPSVPEPTRRPAAAASSARLAARNAELEAQVAGLRDQIASLQQRLDQAPRNPQSDTAKLESLAGELVSLRTELREVKAILDSLRERTSTSGAAWFASSLLEALVVFLIGLLFGLLVGIAYGRRQERGRRGKIRL